MTIIIATTLLCFGAVGYSWFALRSAQAERDRASLSHAGALEALKTSRRFHDKGEDLYRTALDSYQDGQQFWAAATEALLDVKRREVEVNALVDSLKTEGLIPLDFVTGKEAA